MHNPAPGVAGATAVGSALADSVTPLRLRRRQPGSATTEAGEQHPNAGSYRLDASGYRVEESPILSPHTDTLP